MKKYKEFLIPVVSVVLMLLLVLSTQYRIKEIKQEKNFVIDSLKAEIFAKDIELGRYEYIMDNLDSTTRENIDSMLSETE
jgi:hypothetical protein